MGLGGDEEIARLKARVDAMEELFADVASLLRKHAAKVKQPDLLSFGPTPEVAMQLGITSLRDSMVATFERMTGTKYLFEGAKDGAALKRLVSMPTPLVLGRWEESIKLASTNSYPGSRSIALFASRINSFGKSSAPVVGAAPAGDLY